MRLIRTGALVMTGLCAALVSANEPPSAARPFVGTVLQLSSVAHQRTDEDWARLFTVFARLGIEQLVVQWSAYDGQTFLAEGENTGAVSPLRAIFDHADAAQMQVLVGLYHDPRFEPAIRRDESLVAVYLRRLRLEDEALSEQVAHRFGERGSFAGWYLSQEIDDVHWLTPTRRQLLVRHLAELGAMLDARTPNKEVAISGFSNAFADPEGLEALWRDILAATTIDRVLFQDGIGAQKQRLEDVGLFFSAVRRAARANGRIMQPIVELFEMVGTEADEPFRATPASVDRVRRQLAVARDYADAGVLAFSVADYMADNRDPASVQLFDYFSGSMMGSEPDGVAQPSAAVAHQPVVEEDHTPRDVDLPRRSAVQPKLPGQPEVQRKVFELQLGLFYHRARAESMISAWRQRDYEPFLVEVKSDAGLTRYTVRLGPYASMAEAQTASRQLEALEKLRPIIRFRTKR